MGQHQGCGNNKEKIEITKNHFEFMYVVGRGGFGKVWKVESKKLKKLYAMKEMSKAKVIDKKSEKSIKYERELLARLKHPFIVNMQFAFQDFDNLYLVMDLLTGGDLRYHISRHKKFSEEQTRFFIACMVLGLEYIHKNNVLHRDIKPENLVLDERGYVRITDFGIGKIYQRENSSETSGTPGYMSPEVMCAQNHTFVVDYFALGVIGYEFMNGKRPYLGRSRKEIKEQIMAKQVQVKQADIPSGWSSEAADFINKCLQRKPAYRLGLKGAQELKNHPWLKYYPWEDLYNKKIESPFQPKVGDNFDRRYCEAPDKIGNATKERYERYIRDENFQFVFNNFTYINYEEAGIKVPKSENKPESLINSKVNTYQKKYTVSGSSSLRGHSANNLSKSKLLERSQSKVNSQKNYNNYLKSNYSSGNQIKLTPYREKKYQSYADVKSIINKNPSGNTSTQLSRKNSALSQNSNVSSSKVPQNRLPNINKLKFGSRIVGSSSTTNVFKSYKNSSNSQSSTGSSIGSSLKFFNK